MECVICKTGATHHGHVTVTLERNGSIIAIKEVPAMVCNNCGEYYLDTETTKEEMKNPNFAIDVIADITCDIDGSIPCTVKSTTIEEPVFGWHSLSEKVVAPFQKHTVDVMAVGNLPCELPLDASTEFGTFLIHHVLPELIDNEDGFIIKRATISKNGALTETYNYLKDYVE